VRVCVPAQSVRVCASVDLCLVPPRAHTSWPSWSRHTSHSSVCLFALPAISRATARARDMASAIEKALQGVKLTEQQKRQLARMPPNMRLEAVAKIRKSQVRCARSHTRETSSLTPAIHHTARGRSRGGGTLDAHHSTSRRTNGSRRFENTVSLVEHLEGQQEGVVVVVQEALDLLAQTQTRTPRTNQRVHDPLLVGFSIDASIYSFTHGPMCCVS